MRTLSRRAAALTILATLTLTGCGSSDSSDGDSSKDSKESSKSSETRGFDAEPADGGRIKGTDYTYSVPKGWEVPKNKPAGFDFDSLAVDSTDKDGFSDNINVLRQSPAPSGVTTEELTKNLGSELTKQGARDVKTQEPVTIDGESATHISMSQELNGNKNLTEQYYVLRKGALYVVTFSHSTSVTEADRDEVAGSVLTTWKWS
ncbi:hypothetical protein [Aeromicrobium chenweiae]|uniref:Uncharacterized protein n=1 Tax=Aeromicrobium chenweiae TaxID=2079793 RepID=A0A2S0WR23_9ACTN|nr:hypothetical protein [Aeromicrobium chenweiae]AWB93762.1 hypothetical protein C3E78_16940 [Aeromicrobium chenweiae]TGN30389.1 hypothetical protein E4L97_17055 [Aeromicrobium chenweiae]